MRTLLQFVCAGPRDPLYLHICAPGLSKLPRGGQNEMLTERQPHLPFAPRGSPWLPRDSQRGMSTEGRDSMGAFPQLPVSAASCFCALHRSRSVGGKVLPEPAFVMLVCREHVLPDLPRAGLVQFFGESLG